MFRISVREIGNFDGLTKEIILRFIFDDRNIEYNGEMVDLVVKLLAFNGMNEFIFIRNESKIFDFPKLADFIVNENTSTSQSLVVYIDSDNEPNFKIDRIEKASSWITWLISDQFKLTSLTYNLDLLTNFASKYGDFIEIVREKKPSYYRIKFEKQVIHGIRGCKLCKKIVPSRLFMKHHNTHQNLDSNVESFCLFNLTDSNESKNYLKNKFENLLKRPSKNSKNSYRLLLVGKREILNFMYLKIK